jgi:poly(hydroxyalkanoate) granule-associated protein
MAKLKKSARAKSASARAASPDLQAKAEQMSRSIVDSAQQIWMAGMGAFNRAQGEGSKLFEALVKEGMTLENTTRRLATRRVDAVRDAVEDRVGVVRERAVDTWDRLEKVFEDRVQRALTRLGVPAREDLVDLTARVDGITSELRRQSGAGSRPAKTTKAKPAKSARPAKAARAAKPAKAARTAKPAKSTTPARRAAARKSLPKTAKPVAPTH